MNERSLISLTAITLLTGVVLLVVGHAFLGFIAEEPSSAIAITEPGPVQLEESDHSDNHIESNSEVQQTLYSNSRSPESFESQEPQSTSPTLAEPETGLANDAPETADHWMIDAPAETEEYQVASELTLQAPIAATPEETAVPVDSYLEADEEPAAAEEGFTDVYSDVEYDSETEQAISYVDETPLYQPVDDASVTSEVAIPSPAMPADVALKARPQGPPLSAFQPPVVTASEPSQVVSISDSGYSLDENPSAVVTPVGGVADFPPAMPVVPTSPLEEHPTNTNMAAPTENTGDPLRLGPATTRVAQVPMPGQANDMLENEAERALRSSQDDAPAPGEPEIDKNALENEETKLGEAPEEPENELQFLRRQSVLLDPGQYQFDVSLQYLINESDSPLAQVADEFLQIGEALRKQRLLLLPIEFRLGLTPVSQFFINVPFGWSNGEISFLGVDEFQNSGGLGDISAGITRMLMEGNEWFPDVLTTLAFSAPTGDSNFVTSLSTPGNALGQGFWTTTIGLSFIQTYDPMVFFYGFGYSHRYENTFDVNVGDGRVTVNPGKQIFYRFGAGFAVNPRVTLSASFNGSYITEDVVEGVRLAGSIREPMSIRLAATITKDKELKKNQRVRTIEPFVNFGLTDAAANAVFGVSCTH